MGHWHRTTESRWTLSCAWRRRWWAPAAAPRVWLGPRGWRSRSRPSSWRSTFDVPSSGKWSESWRREYSWKMNWIMPYIYRKQGNSSDNPDELQYIYTFIHQDFNYGSRPGGPCTWAWQWRCNATLTLPGIIIYPADGSARLASGKGLGLFSWFPWLCTIVICKARLLTLKSLRFLNTCRLGTWVNEWLLSILEWISL